MCRTLTFHQKLSLMYPPTPTVPLPGWLAFPIPPSNTQAPSCSPAKPSSYLFFHFSWAMCNSLFQPGQSKVTGELVAEDRLQEDQQQHWWLGGSQQDDGGQWKLPAATWGVQGLVTRHASMSQPLAMLSVTFSAISLPG